MSLILDAVERCERYGLDPAVGFKSQYVIAREGRLQVPGMSELPVNKWSLLHGEAVCPELLKDEKDRVFGVFFGTGVDSAGCVLSAASFARFNSKSLSFEADLEEYLSGVAGRFVMMLDSGTKTRIYRDPMGHMPLFYNPESKLAAASVSLSLDRPVVPNSASAQPGETPLSAVAVFPVGQTMDAEVRLLPGNHVLDLADFTAHRGWPLRNTIRKVTAAKAAPVIDRMAMRLRDIVQSWIAQGNVALPLDAGVGSRILLAAAGDKRDELERVCVVHLGQATDANTLAVTQLMATAAGVTQQPMTRGMAFETFGRARTLRHERKCLFWLRTSSAVRVPTETKLGIDALYPSRHLVLTSAGLDALQGGWQMGDPTPKPMRDSKTAELTAALAQKPEKAVKDAVEPDYDRWKFSLPKTLQSQVEDFIRIELHQPPQAVATLGVAEHLTASPFSDRELIELALKLPLRLRSGEIFAEALIAALDANLAGLPYEVALPQSTAAE
ncbi:MAG: hypothetical protein AAFO72_09675 [Pseudomonadota bacterium]